MKLEKLLDKIYQLEGLIIALDKLVDLEIIVQPECYECFNGVCSIINILKYKIREIKNDVSKHV